MYWKYNIMEQTYIYKGLYLSINILIDK